VIQCECACEPRYLVEREYVASPMWALLHSEVLARTGKRNEGGWRSESRGDRSELS